MGDDKSIPKAARITQQAPEMTRIESAEEIRKANGQGKKTVTDRAEGTVFEDVAPAISEADKKPTPAKQPAPATRLESLEEARGTSKPRPATGVEAPASRPAVPREATRLESAEEIRKLVAETRAAQLAPSAPQGPTPPAVSFRPLRRAPTALLTICDDGATTGETIRVRGDRAVIGRDQGDIRIPNDAQMSSSHCEIVREPAEASWRWVIADLQSANGTFVRTASMPLKHGQEFLIGSTRLRFDDAALNLPGAIQDAGPAMPIKTVGWQAFAPTDLKASIVVILPDAAEKRHFLDATEQWIGRDWSCPIQLPNDTLADPKHARVARDSKGNWSLIDGNSQNGVWARVLRHVATAECEFQLGEQRFVLRTG